MTYGMSAFIYVWKPEAKQWLFADMRETEEAARELGRDLWRSGVAGIKIDVITTVVKEIRK